nr:hypothetical protein [Tanacetum cinerariifolium]
MEVVKKSIDERAHHKREYDNMVIERHMQTIEEKSSRNNSKNMPRFSSSDMVHNHYLEEAKKKTKGKKCVFNANHDSCVTKFPKEVNSHAKVPSNKITNKNKPAEQLSVAKKPERQILKGHSSELEIHNHNNERSSSKLVPKVVHLADTTAPSKQELGLLFGPLYDEFFTTGTSCVNKSSSPTDNSTQQNTPPLATAQSSIELITSTTTITTENNM